MQELLEEKNEKIKNINFKNQKEHILKNENLNNNNNINEYLDNEKELEQPFFIMTLEFEKGKYKKIKIYPDSDPTELAFNFCKVNNLDFASMKYINSEIETLLMKFKSNSNLEEMTNNSIQEVEEENVITEKTLNSIEKSKEDLFKKDINEKKSENKLSSQEYIYSSLESEKKINNILNNNNNNKIKLLNSKDEIFNFEKKENNIINLIEKEKTNKNKEESVEKNNNPSITVSNNNTMKVESANITNSVRTNKDPRTSADSNLISNTSSCDSPKGKNEKIQSLEEIKELSQDQNILKEKFIENFNNTSNEHKNVNFFNYFNFDKISKVSNNNINKCFTDDNYNNSSNINNRIDSQNNIKSFSPILSSNNSNKPEIKKNNIKNQISIFDKNNENKKREIFNFRGNINFQNNIPFKFPYDILNNYNENLNKKNVIFSHPDINELLELKKKKDEEIRALEEEQIIELNEKKDLEEKQKILEEEDKKEREEYLLYERNEKTKKLIKDFSSEKIENNIKNNISKTNRNSPSQINNISNKHHLILDEIDNDFPNKFLSQKFEKVMKNHKKLKDNNTNIEKELSNQFNITSNKTGRNNNYSNNNILVEKSIDIFLSGKDIFKTNKEENLIYNLSSNLDISITNRNLTNTNTTNNNNQLQDISQLTKQINRISTNKKSNHKHIPLPTSPSNLTTKYKNNKLFQYEILEGKKDYYYDPSFSKNKEYSHIKSYTSGNLINITQRSSKKKNNRSLSRNHSKSKSQNIFNKLYKEVEINKQLPKRPYNFSYRINNLGFTFDGQNYFTNIEDKKNIKSLKTNFNNINNNFIHYNLHSENNDKGKKMNYGEYLYKRGIEERDLRNEKLQKIRSKLEKNDKDKYLFKPKINKNFRPLRNKSMFEISQYQINETQDLSNEVKEKKDSSKKKKQKNINLLNKNNNEFQNPYIQKKLDKLKKDFEQKYTFKPKINDNYNFSPGLNFFKKQEIYNEYAQKTDITKIDNCKKFPKNNSLSRTKKKGNFKKKNSFNTCCSALMLRNKPVN